MHAVVVRAAITELDKARQALEADVIPRVKAAPGFIAGYWMEPIDGKGISVVLFESEDAARGALAMVQPGSKPSPYATIESSEAREVVAHA